MGRLVGVVMFPVMLLISGPEGWIQDPLGVNAQFKVNSYLFGGIFGFVIGTPFLPFSYLFDENPCTFGTDKPSENKEEDQVGGNLGLE